VHKCLLCNEKAEYKAYNKHIPNNIKGWSNSAWFCAKCSQRLDIKQSWIFKDCSKCVNYGKTDGICWDCVDGSLYKK